MTSDNGYTDFELLPKLREEEKRYHLYAERHMYQKVKGILNFIPFMESVAWKLDAQ